MRLLILLLASSALVPGAARAQIDGAAGKPGQGAPAKDTAVPERPAEGREKPIVSDAEFSEALPQLSDDMDAPLEQMAAPATPLPPVEPIVEAPPLDEAGAEAEIAAPLPPLEQFDATPIAEAVAANDAAAVEIRYVTRVTGLDAIGLEDEFRDLSALEDGDGVAANAAIIGARAREDEGLAVRLMKSIGYYDATATSTLEQTPQGDRPVTATVAAVPGPLYRFGQIRVEADPTLPPTLIADNLKLRTGEPIDAVRVQAAEAAVSVALPQNGYPFAEVGQRDILLDEAERTGDYTLPVTVGPRGRFGAIRTEGDAVFAPDHIDVLTRFDRADLYDSRKVDDLRKAMVGTGLFSTVAVEPEETGTDLGDGTQSVQLNVKQDAGPPRTIAGSLGYAAGEGITAQGSWTHRNMWPPEGALIAHAIAGTQQQGLGATFRRSNAGKRDRTLEITAEAFHNDYDAYSAYTGRLAARISRDSTPIWQKRYTYAFGVELLGTAETSYNFESGERERNTYYVAGVNGQVGFDTSDSLLDPTKGFRVTTLVQPEATLNNGFDPYVRARIDGSAYFPATDSLVLAGRVRFGTIQGVDLVDIAPSRRLYAGGGGSVRGFSYQGLGEQAPDGKPIGGRSLNEASFEARYRFGNYGVVAFVDAGQAYRETMPQFNDLRYGVGIGGRFYTNFGPMRLDIATPIARRPGESRINLYLSIGQAF